MQALHGWRACLPPLCLVQPGSPGCCVEGAAGPAACVHVFLLPRGWHQLVGRTDVVLIFFARYDVDHSHCLAALAMPSPANYCEVVVMMIVYVPAEPSWGHMHGLVRWSGPESLVRTVGRRGVRGACGGGFQQKQGQVCRWWPSATRAAACRIVSVVWQHKQTNQCCSMLRQT
jgi:hypothetical protein